MKLVKGTLHYLFDFSLTILAIILMVILALFLHAEPTVDKWELFTTYLKGLFQSIVSIDQLYIQYGDMMKEFSFLTLFQERYTYSLAILAGALLTTFLAALLLVLLQYFSPKRIKRILREIAFVLQSIPDVLLIFAIQLAIIWFYKKTGILIFDPYTGFDKIYLLPILTLSILPIVMLFQMMDLSVSEEEEKLYVEFAYSKGLSRREVFFKHILRNTALTMFANLQYLFWFMISNLLIMEFLFNMDGLMKFLWQMLNNPVLIVISLVFLFIPFYLLDVVGKSFAKRIAGGDQQ